MPTSEAALDRGAGAAAAPIFDGKLVKWIVLVSGLVPASLLGWDALHGQLGANDVNFAIRSTGMLGLVFMTLSLVITPLRRLTGWAPLLSVRRNLGVYGFLYILTHFTIFFLFDREGSISSTYEEITTREYLWYGFGSLVIMLPLALTSFDSMVTRLGPKRWKLLHRLAYVAVVCGIVHFYELLKADKTYAIAFAVVFGGLMLYRIVRHYLDLRGEVKTHKDKLSAAKKAGPKKKKFWSGTVKVARIFEETHNVKTFRMVPETGGPLPFEAVAGQYLNLALVIDGKRVNRSYTIASAPTRSSYVEISVKRDGLASKFLHASVKEGDTIKVSAPAGKFYFAGHEADRVVLVAGGVGITPMMSVIRSLTDRCWRGDIYLIFAVRRRNDVIFENELMYLTGRFPNLHVKVTLTGEPEDGDKPGGLWDGARGRISKELVEQFVPRPIAGPVMLCGPEPQMQAARKLFVELGVPNERVLEEAFVSPPPAKDDATADAAMSAPAETGDTDGDHVVTFRRAGKTADGIAGLTVLEAAEEHDISLPFECRSGICGQCKCKLVSGRVVMEVQDALTPADKAKGLILACQARPVQNCEVDA